MENKILSVINQLNDIDFMKLDISLGSEYKTELRTATVTVDEILKNLEMNISLLEKSVDEIIELN